MKVLVIGSGPAGLMAAIAAAKAGHFVSIIEKNQKIGRKLYISGKGRCNITNTRPNFLENVISNPKFVYSAIFKFSPNDCIAFFQDLGVSLKTERGGRVFPLSDKSSDVIDALYHLLKKLKIDILFDEALISLVCEGNKITKAITNNGEHLFDHYILATGGLSYPQTGSDGIGLRIAKDLDLNIISPKSALSSLILNTSDLPEGISLKNVTAAIGDINGKKVFSEFGEMLFTGQGVSGPIILTLSSKINRIIDNMKLFLIIDMKPALEEKLLDARILRDFNDNSNKSLKNIMTGLMPEGVARLVLKQANLSSEMKVNMIKKEQRIELVKKIKNLTFEILSLGAIENAIVTAGGISVDEIDPSTMKSKKYKNLSFAGEIIDIDGLTGGYNIQLAFSTGFLSGSSI